MASPSAAVQLPSDEDTLLFTAARLKRRLAALVNDVRGIRDQGTKAIKDPSQIPLFKGMLRSLDSTYEKMEAVWTELMDLDEEQGAQLLVEPEDRETRAKGQRYFYEASSSAEALISTSRISVLGSPLSSSHMRPSMRNILPTVPIPSFSGDRAKWRTFRDVFDAVVNNDPSLTDAERFHYLAGALKGPAAGAISRIPHTGDNYSIAWRALNKAL